MAIPTIVDTDPVAPLENLLNIIGGGANAEDATLDTRVDALETRSFAPVANLAALDAISTATVGSLVWMTTPGTGIDPMIWEAYSGSGATIDWRPLAQVIAATKANLDSFVSAVAAISDTRFRVGGLAQVTATGVYYRFTSTAGAYVPIGGLIPVIPTSVAGTGVTLGPNGRITASAAAPISVNGCFTSEFEDYLIKLRLVASTPGVAQYRLRASGSDAATAYDDQRITGTGLSAAAASGTGSTSWSNLATGPLANQFTTMTLFRPQVAAATGALASFYETNLAGTQGKADWGGDHRTTSSYDGFSIIASAGTFTGTIRVYAYNDN